MHLWKSLREYVVEVATAWFAWAIAVLTGAVDAAKQIFPGVHVPRLALISGYAAALLLAQFKAFHRARIARDQRRPGAEPGTPGAVATPALAGSRGLAAVEPADGDSAMQRMEQREVLARLGMVNPLVGRFQISNFAPPLAHDQPGTVIRIVLGASQPPADAKLSGAIKRELEAALAASAFESWLRTEADCGEIGEGSGGAWKRASPNTGYVTTLKRMAMHSLGGGSCLSAKSTLQLPVGPTSGPYLILLIDLVEQAAATAEDGETGPRLRFTLEHLHELLHVLARTAVDEVGARVFPLVFGKPPDLLGPSFEVSFGDRILTEVLRLPSRFHRPDDVTSSSPWAYIHTPDGSDARDLTARDRILRDGIIAILQQNEFDDVEDDVGSLPLPPSTYTQAWPEEVRIRSSSARRVDDDGNAGGSD